MLTLLQRLLAAAGVSGHEGQVREAVQEVVEKFGTLETDALGNLFLTLGEGSPHILLLAHMDELGLLVTHTEENGGLRFRKVGATGGRTDGAAIQRAGVGAHMMAISVAVRYLHSMVEICHLDDLENLVNLLVDATMKLAIPQVP